MSATAEPTATADRWRVVATATPTGTLAVARPRSQAERPLAGARDVLVLLHGFTGSHRSWDEVADHLAPRLDVIAIDLPGHGASRFGDDPAAHTMESASAALDAALNGLGVRSCVPVGYSMGGRFALYYALRPRADRKRSPMLDALVLESAGPGIADPEQRAARLRADEELAQFAIDHGVEAFVDRWERVPVLAAEAKLSAEVRRVLRQQRLGCRADGLAASLRGMGAGSQRWLGGRLGEINVPTLLVAGSEDAKYAAVAQQMAASLADVTVRVARGAGHNVHLERPAAFASMIEQFVVGVAAGRNPQGSPRPGGMA